MKTKAVKRKRQSDGETVTEQKDGGVKLLHNNNVKLPVTLEITPVPGSSKSSTSSTSSSSSTSSVESPPSTDQQPRKSIDENQVEDEEDEGNDVVMVELDEEFVVEQLDKKSECDGCLSQDESGAVEVFGEEQSNPVHRCVLCGRTFKHYANLQIHLTGHLGVKVNIFMCTICKRKFRNKTELDLHTRSHQFAKLLGKSKVTKEKVAAKAKVITTSGTADKKIIRKYLKGQDKVTTNGPAKENSVKTQ